MTLYESVLNAQQTMTVASYCSSLLGNNNEIIEIPFTTNEGTIYCIPKAVMDTVKSKRYITDYDYFVRTDIHSQLFKINLVKFPTPAIVTSMLETLASSSAIYGVLGYQENSDTPVNLLNPLTPSSQLTVPYKTLAVYSYASTEETDQEVITKELTLLTYIIIAISQAYHYKYKPSGSIELSFNTTATKSVEIKTNNVTILPATETEENGLVPHYFLTRGIYYPFYGVSAYHMTERGRRGTFITNMLSANISNSESICIGQLPASDYNSFRSLNCSNIDSPYTTSVLPHCYASIAEANKQLMLTILKGLSNDNNRPTS